MNKKKNELVTRCYKLEIRANEDEEKKGYIYGTPIVFGKPTIIRDWYGQFEEIIDEKALDNADLKDVRLFINHDTSKITLARSKNGKGTMELKKGSHGLDMGAYLDIENNSEARALYSAVSRGDMDGMSFMFEINGEKWDGLDTDLPRRTITSIKIVHEVSVVNFPAYEATSVSARSGEETSVSILEEARKAYLEETKRTNKEALELEKLKIKYRMEGYLYE